MSAGQRIAPSLDRKVDLCLRDRAAMTTWVAILKIVPHQFCSHGNFVFHLIQITTMSLTLKLSSLVIRTLSKPIAVSDTVPLSWGAYADP